MEEGNVVVKTEVYTFRFFKHSANDILFNIDYLLPPYGIFHIFKMRKILPSYLKGTSWKMNFSTILKEHEISGNHICSIHC